jgi:hypothetical protein
MKKSLPEEGRLFVFSVEAATGFEPVNNGFADRCLSHLAMPPSNTEYWNGLRMEEWKMGKEQQTLRPRYQRLGSTPIIPIFQYSIIPFFLLERETGLEPATTTLATWGSTN